MFTFPIFAGKKDILHTQEEFQDFKSMVWKTTTIENKIEGNI